MARPTNQELCAAFRKLITEDFYVVNDDGEILTPTKSLRATKPWRNDLWRAFRELEDRLCPVQAFQRA